MSETSFLPFNSLLQPKSYVSSTFSSHSYAPHSQNDIRASTMQLSNMYLSPSQLQLQPPGRDEFIFPMVQSGQSPGQSVDESGIIVYRPDIPHLVLSTSRRSSVYSGVENLSASTTTASTETSTSTTDTVTTEDTRAATPTRSVSSQSLWTLYPPRSSTRRSDFIRGIFVKPNTHR